MTAQGPLFRDYTPVPQTPGVADHAAPTTTGVLVSRIRKALVALVGGAALVLSTGVLEENAEVWVNALLALATAAGVYAAPNAPAKLRNGDAAPRA